MSDSATWYFILKLSFQIEQINHNVALIVISLIWSAVDQNASDVLNIDRLKAREIFDRIS